MFTLATKDGNPKPLLSTHRRLTNLMLVYFASGSVTNTSELNDTEFRKPSLACTSPGRFEY